MDHLLPTTTTKDARQHTARIAVLPVGSYEQHGDHLPLTTDTLLASTIAQAITDAYDLWLLPPVAFGCSHEHSAWPGTLSISASTLHQVVTDVADSAAAAGQQLAIVNGHGGNYVLANAAQEANAKASHPQVTLFPSSDDLRHARSAANLESSNKEDMHAGEFEVSLLLYAHPDVISPGYAESDHGAPERPLLHLLGMPAYTTNGVIGRPSLATAEKGHAVLAALIKRFEHHIKALTSS